MSKKMGELNSIYDLQLQGSKDYVDSTTKYFAGVNQLMQNLSDSVADTKRYKDEIAQLGSNLEALNTVYGNMLSAMNFRKA
jgi:gliding motility-associated protein GldL